MSSIFKKVLSTCDFELLETLKNIPEFSYEGILSMRHLILNIFLNG